MVALDGGKKEIVRRMQIERRSQRQKIAKELAEKSSLVDRYNDEREEKFTVFAKSFSNRVEEFEGRIHSFDFRDLERFMKG